MSEENDAQPRMHGIKICNRWLHPCKQAINVAYGQTSFRLKLRRG